MASNQTSNYKLNQWAAEDRIIREEFNADNQKIETALSSIQATAAKVNSKADTSELTKLSAQVANKADTSTLNTKIAGVMDTIPVVSLGTWTIASGSETYTLDLSKMDLTPYAGLRLRFQIQNNSELVYLRLGSCTTYLQAYVETGSSNSKTAIQLLNYTGMGHIDLYPFGSQMVAFARILQKNSNSNLEIEHSIAYTTSSLSLGSLSSLTFSREEGTFGAGCSATLYGLRY